MKNKRVKFPFMTSRMGLKLTVKDCFLLFFWMTINNKARLLTVFQLLTDVIRQPGVRGKPHAFMRGNVLHQFIENHHS